MTRYMLDTNIVSYLLKKHPVVARRVIAVPITDLSISAITQGELLFGLARRPKAKALHEVVREFLRRVDICPGTLLLQRFTRPLVPHPNPRVGC